MNNVLTGATSKLKRLKLENENISSMSFVFYTVYSIMIIGKIKK